MKAGVGGGRRCGATMRWSRYAAVRISSAAGVSCRGVSQLPSSPPHTVTRVMKVTEF
jgi:hypothetical protein